MEDSPIACCALPATIAADPGWEPKIKEDKTIIEDLIKAAHNNAKSQLKSKTSEEISKATGGFGIPGFKWPL